MAAEDQIRNTRSQNFESPVWLSQIYAPLVITIGRRLSEAKASTKTDRNILLTAS